MTLASSHHQLPFSSRYHTLAWNRPFALHETDRLAALTQEINALGGNVEELESSLRITPTPLHGGVFHTHDDHRLATAGAVIGLVVPGIEVENIATTRKTLPDFPGLWSSLLS